MNISTAWRMCYQVEMVVNQKKFTLKITQDHPQIIKKNSLTTTIGTKWHIH